ncbi:hypothetical protein KK2020170_25150 [Flavobacterium okayamense]|uniref:Secretion system C-terminal sorting domain-containing protein n=2 Tax=Flavobacterium okayamense TaxID=2830782 RepID=A0ABM7SA67_9FLAO|nr:hypothetical protein KK2020170_25150 [Flavobacterium okayamense]
MFAFYGVNLNSQTFDWVKTTGNATNDYATKIATDASGNVYALGTYSGTLDLDPSSGTLNVTAVGGTDIFIQKFDAAGNFINGISIGGPGNDVGSSILIDNNGYTTVAGVFEQIIDLDPSAAQNGHAVYNFGTSKDFFIVKYDDLAYAFSKAIGGAGDDIVNAMDVDSNNNLILTGIYRGTVDFNPNISVNNSLTTTSGGEAYVLKLDTNLDYVWAKSFVTTDTNGNMGTSIKVDSTDNIIVAGTFKGASDFDPNAGVQSVSAQTSFSAGFIVKLSSVGNYIWKATLNTTDNNISGNIYASTQETFLREIAIDVNDNVVAIGTFRGRVVDFDPNSGTVNINSDMHIQSGSPTIYTYKNTGYLWKLSSTGSYVWAGAIRTNSSYVSGGDIHPFALVFDNNNDFYFSGHFRQNIDLNPASGYTWLTSNGNNDVFIGKFSGSTNDLIWARSYGGANNVYTNDMKISAGKLLLFGSFAATVDFDPNSGTQNATSQGGNDTYLLSLNETSLLSNSSFTGIDFKIYPNPVSSNLNLQTELDDFNYTIYSIEGKVVKQGKSNISETSVDVSNLNAGIYLVELESNGTKSIQKIIKH